MKRLIQKGVFNIVMFERILVAVDGSKHSDAAFDMAVDLSQKYGSSLTVLHVFQGSTGGGTLASGVDEDANKSIGQEILDAYAKKLESKSLQNARFLLAKGDAALKIIETANANDCRLVVLGSRGRGAFKELLLGSISHKVTNHAGCPVLIVR
jgi:nucleotide-binding universal stress UspA family protein